jgi:hypothetical protein
MPNPHEIKNFLRHKNGPFAIVKQSTYEIKMSQCIKTQSSYEIKDVTTQKI